tara:strand:+ start:20 stop:547 length:528 start_codon:yes stop_codon:yes gene_type:complete
MAGQRLTDKSALENHTGSGDLYMVVDVSDTTGSAAGTSKKLDSKFVIQTDKISLSNAEILDLDHTPKLLITAPGSGYFVQIITATFHCTYAASTESSSNNAYIGYGNAGSTSFYWQWFRDIMNADTGDRVFYPSSTNLGGNSTVDNEGVYVFSNAAFNGGWSGDIYITYQIVKLS